MQTTVTELPESRVRVDAEVSAKEVERSVEQAAKALGKDMKMPGFRAGKVPTPVVIKRFGREMVLDQAVRTSLGKWYVDALEDSKIVPVGDPDLDLADMPEPGEPLKFHFEIGVRPVAKLGDYKGLEVGRREPEPDPADIDAELEQLRERAARLETVEEPAARGDYVVMDYVGSIDELREDITAKLREAEERKAEAEYREGVLDAVAANAKITVPDALARARATELWDRMLHSLSHQGISKEMYLKISGKDEDEIVAEALPDAEQALRREAVLAAVIEAEGIEAADGDVLDALQSTAARENTTPEKLRDRLDKAGRLDELRDDLAQRAAVDFLVEHAKPIDAGRAAAREKIWTPGS